MQGLSVIRRFAVDSRGVTRPEPEVGTFRQGGPASRPEPPPGATARPPAGGPAQETGTPDDPTGRPGRTRRAALAALGSAAVGAAAGWFSRGAVSPLVDDGGDAGLFYHRESSLGVRDLLGGIVDWGRRPPSYKQVGTGAAVPLPVPVRPPTMSVAQALRQRRSLRQYADRAVTGEELAWLLSAAAAITAPGGLRSAPSAGALYPIETYVAADRVEGVAPGLYHLDVRAQGLEPMRSGSVSADLAVAGLGQDALRTAPVVLVLTGLFQRTRWKYHQRHYRYVCWEGGHIAQNVYLAAEAAGLGACMIGAFLDGGVNDLLHVDGRHEAALGLLAIGPR